MRWVLAVVALDLEIWVLDHPLESAFQGCPVLDLLDPSKLKVLLLHPILGLRLPGSPDLYLRDPSKRTTPMLDRQKLGIPLLSPRLQDRPNTSDDPVLTTLIQDAAALDPPIEDCKFEMRRTGSKLSV